MPGFIINQDRANQSVGTGVKPVNKITTYEEKFYYKYRNKV